MKNTQSTPDAESHANYHHGNLRLALLDAAEEELSEKGIERFSLRGVAKRAGVSHGAPAHHFQNAIGLLTALATRGYQQFIQAQDKRERQAANNPKARLAASGLGYLDFATENPALFQLMFSSSRPDKSDVHLAQAADEAFDKLVHHIAGITGANPHEDPDAMAAVIAAWGVVHGLADLLIADRLGRAEFLATYDHKQRDLYFSDIILKSVCDHSSHSLAGTQ